MYTAIGCVVFALCSGNILELSNPAFHPNTTPGATEEKILPVKNGDEADGGKDEKESLKEEIIGTLV